MTAFLRANGIRIFDYPQFAAGLRDAVRENAAKVIVGRGDHPGLVHVLSAMETCDACKPSHDKKTNKIFLHLDSGKCLHY